MVWNPQKTLSLLLILCCSISSTIDSDTVRIAKSRQNGAILWPFWRDSYSIDGDMRTGQILANALLEAAGSFPLALRAVNVETYKLAILAFYELGTLGNAKQVFIDQARFAAENYSV